MVVNAVKNKTNRQLVFPIVPMRERSLLSMTYGLSRVSISLREIHTSSPKIISTVFNEEYDLMEPSHSIFRYIPKNWPHSDRSTKFNAQRSTSLLTTKASSNNRSCLLILLLHYVFKAILVFTL